MDSNDVSAQQGNKSESPIRVGELVQIRRRGKKGIWVAEFRFNGEHRRLTLGSPRRLVAERKARELEVHLANGSYSQAPKPRDLDAAIDQYIECKKVEGRSRKTIVKYKAELKCFKDFARQNRATQVHELSASLQESIGHSGSKR